MADKELNETDLKDVLEKIEKALVEAGIAAGSVEITFKNSAEVSFSSTDEKLQAITPKISCHLCGGGGMVGVCCNF